MHWSTAKQAIAFNIRHNNKVGAKPTAAHRDDQKEQHDMSVHTLSLRGQYLPSYISRRSRCIPLVALFLV